MAFARFMSQPVGRIIRAVLGLMLIALGFLVIVVGIIGFVPLAAGSSTSALSVRSSGYPRSLHRPRGVLRRVHERELHLRGDRWSEPADVHPGDLARFGLAGRGALGSRPLGSARYRRSRGGRNPVPQAQFR
jgi:hypothetical protein